MSEYFSWFTNQLQAKYILNGINYLTITNLLLIISVMSLIIHRSGQRNWWDTTPATANLESVNKKMLGIVPFTLSNDVTDIEMKFQ